MSVDSVESVYFLGILANVPRALGARSRRAGSTTRVVC